jgi:hypothetical protein
MSRESEENFTLSDYRRIVNLWHPDKNVGTARELHAWQPKEGLAAVPWLPRLWGGAPVECRGQQHDQARG